jgi:alkylated DNA repair dioxygenase AlkB
MSWLSRFALIAGLAAGMGGLSAAAQAAPASAAPMLGVATLGSQADMLQEVRWVQRCRPVVVHRRDRRGRPVRVERQQCRRVWVGPPRRGY